MPASYTKDGRGIRSILLFPVFFLVVVSFVPGYRASGTCFASDGSPAVRAGSELDFRPYAYTDKDGRPTGFGVELLKAVGDKMGLSIRFTTGPWDEVWNGLVEGTIDVLPVVARTPGREPLVDFSLPHTETFDAFFVRGGRPELPDLSAAAGMEIVVLRSDAAHHELVERNFAGKVIPVESIPEGMRRIAAGRHDAMLCSKLVGVLELGQAGIKGVQPGPPIPDYKRVFSFAVRKGDADLLEKLNQGLRIVKATGEYERIYQKWLTAEEPWRRWLPYFKWALAVFVLLGVLVATLQWLVRKRTRELARARDALQELNATLEERVAERTAALRESDGRFRRAQEIAHLGSWELDLVQNRLTWSDEAYRIFGLQPREFGATYEAFLEHVHPDDRRMVDDAYGESLRLNRDSYEVEHRVVRRDTGEIRMVHEKCEHFRDGAGKIVRSVGMVHDITERKRAEEAVASAHRQIQDIIDNTPAVVYALDLEERFLMANTAIAELLNSTPERMIGRRRHDFMPRKDADRHGANDRKVIEAGKALEMEECSHLKGRSITWLTTKFPLRDAQGGIYAVAGISADISERKRAEEALKSALEEKDVLLRELAHRTKNNMQVIASLLGLQAAAMGDKKLVDAVADTQERIRAMALVHENLYQSGNIASLDIKDYVEDLLNSLLRAHKVTGRTIRCNLDIEDLFLSIDAALPSGLIINELVSNSLKHAFRGEKSGEIFISLRRVGNNVELRYRDDGPGLPRDLDVPRLTSLGLKLVHNLAVRQLRGTMEIRHEPVSEFVFVFSGFAHEERT